MENEDCKATFKMLAKNCSRESKTEVNMSQDVERWTLIMEMSKAKAEKRRTKSRLGCKDVQKYLWKRMWIGR